MAIGASKVVSRKTHRRISYVGTDIALRIGDEVVALHEEIGVGAARQFRNVVNGIPVGLPAPAEISRCQPYRSPGQRQDKTDQDG
jgi:hypothetical protein